MSKRNKLLEKYKSKLEKVDNIYNEKLDIRKQKH